MGEPDKPRHGVGGVLAIPGAVPAVLRDAVLKGTGTGSKTVSMARRLLRAGPVVPALRILRPRVEFRPLFAPAHRAPLLPRRGNRRRR